MWVTQYFFLPLLIIAKTVSSDIELSKNETFFLIDIDQTNASVIETSSFSSNSTETYINETEPTIFSTTTTENPVRESLKGQCDCDLSKDICDINCCCDNECPEYAKNAFTICQNISYKESKANFCSTENKNLFCIEYDNLKSIHYYLKTPSYIKEASLSETTFSISPFNWIQSGNVKSMDDGTGFMMGSHINVQIGLKTIEKWSFPKSTVSQLCEGNLPLKYLQDTSSSCNRYLHETITSTKNVLSAESYYKNIWIRSHLKNTSKLCDNSLKESCLPIELSSYYSYQDLNDNLHMHQLEQDSIPSLVLNNSTQLYENVVQGVKYKVIHNGIYGIKSVEVHFVLGTVNSSLPFSQNFKIQFILNNETSDFALKRGGNPGYQNGLPVIIGETVNRSNNNSDTDSSDSSLITIDNLTSFKPGLFCVNSSERRIVKFGFNINIGCYLQILQVNNDSINFCQKMQETARLTLLGHKNYDKVGKYGNPDNINLEDWRLIRKTETIKGSTTESNCTILTDLHLNIAHTMTGLVNSPQIMILGFDMKLVKTKVSLMNEQSLELRTTISFQDMSPVTGFKFGKHPRVKIHLPETFFYPFQLNKASQKNGFCSYWVFITQLFLLGVKIINL